MAEMSPGIHRRPPKGTWPGILELSRGAASVHNGSRHVAEVLSRIVLEFACWRLRQDKAT
jgi:hypothetical protein